MKWTIALCGLLAVGGVSTVHGSTGSAQRSSSSTMSRAGGRPESQPQHGAHAQEKPAPQEPKPHAPATPSKGDHQEPTATAPSTLPANVPPLTEADRTAAFPDVQGHAVHDTAIHSYVLFDQLEWLSGVNGLNLDTKGWVGGDGERVWFRVEGQTERGRIDHAEAHLLYGRAISRWWDLVAGVRQDVRPGPSQTWAAVGIQGLAPYWFEVEATAYIGASAQTHVRLEAEYELLFTNRLVLQPLIEIDLYGKAIRERGIGAGLSSAESGLRLRYEIRRELAPYVGVTWNRTFGGTADFRRAAGEDVGGARLALGLRTWF